jgi:hypothetical protein
MGRPLLAPLDRLGKLPFQAAQAPVERLTCLRQAADGTELSCKPRPIPRHRGTDPLVQLVEC